MHGSFSADGIRDFLYELGQGRSSSTLSVMTSLPEIEDSKPWDGKDAPVFIIYSLYFANCSSTSSYIYDQVFGLPVILISLLKFAH